MAHPVEAGHGGPAFVPHEVEGTLLLLPPDAAESATQIASLEGIGPFKLVARPTLELHDRYLDTEDEQIARRELALRVRECERTVLLTLKGSGTHKDGVSTRSELEAPWSEGALWDAVDRLRWKGIDVPAPKGGYAEDPFEAWASLGFKVVQDRFTRREPRDVLEPGPRLSAKRVAELVVDAVRYRFPDRPVRIFEVEVEAKDGGDAGTVEEVLRALSERLGDRLRSWPYSKLATGFALRTLLERGKLDGQLGPDGELEHAGVEAVDQLLRRAPQAAASDDDD